jgi:hypothetical protein
MHELKKALNDDLLKTKERWKTEYLFSSTPDELFRNWLETVLHVEKKNLPLHFVKLDVAGAYPDMKHDLLREALDRFLTASPSPALVESVLKDTRVRWGSKGVFKMAKGVPQGAFPMSSVLCDIYYAYVLHLVLPDFRRGCLRDGEIFVRYQDDILFGSPDPVRVLR